MLRLTLTEPGKPVGPCGLCKTLYGSTCCERKTGEGPRVPMTYGEAQRIARYHRLPLTDAIEFRAVRPSEESELGVMAGDHVARLVVNGRGLYLPMDGEACRYLGIKGCTLPGPIKPHFCFLFPFSRGVLGWRVGELVRGTGYCFGQDCSMGDVPTMLDLFGVTPEVLERAYARWQRDLKGHAGQLKRLSMR